MSLFLLVVLFVGSKSGALPPTSAPTNLFESSNYVFRAADQEVDALLRQRIPLRQLPLTGGDVSSLTPFQQWKVQSFRYATDTPAASEHHDFNVVNLVANYLKETRAATTASQPASTKTTAALTTTTTTADQTAPRNRSKQSLRFSVAAGGPGSVDSAELSANSFNSAFVRQRDKKLHRLTLSRIGKLSAPTTATRSPDNVFRSDIGIGVDGFPVSPS